MVWALEVARIWLAIFGCAAAGWAVGFGMGYRRGVNDAMMRRLSPSPELMIDPEWRAVPDP